MGAAVRISRPAAAPMSASEAGFLRLLAALAALAPLLAPAGCGNICSPLNPVPTYTVPVLSKGLVEDFEKTGPTANYLGGSNSISLDQASTGKVNWFAPGSTLPGGTRRTSAEFSGIEAPQDPATSTYPYAELLLGMPNPTSGFDVRTVAPGQKLVFSYKAGAASVGLEHIIEFTDKTIQDYSWYQYDFTPTDTAWHQATVYFPGAGAPAFAQATWGSPQIPWPSIASNVTAIALVVVSANSPSPASPYDISIDDVSFE